MKIALTVIYIALLTTITVVYDFGVIELIVTSLFGITAVALGYVTAKDHFE
ncbi:hypothetical protein [Priestia megaterium]|uniref:hypothetical protein n=1 Tax=Priestia megaterium TaxID=1404 RepID=UPI001E08CA21|nr:hypothetical protein [Priestia megaterium]CAH0304262.1 hypothetical protein SRABI82_04666 [Priestia megaterium]